jgi:hypothetical protein
MEMEERHWRTLSDDLSRKLDPANNVNTTSTITTVRGQ